jgi:uncharacterized protein YjbK
MTGSGKEIELKFRVADAEELEALKAALGGKVGAPVEQVNHFFDTGELDLNRTKHVLRLREEVSSFLLTAKGPGGSEERALSERTELETRIDPTTAAKFLDGSASPLSVLEQAIGTEAELLETMRELSAGKTLKRVGKFDNTRTPVAVSVDLGGGVTHELVFELDRTAFPDGRVDFEVEVELQGVESETERERLAQAIRSLIENAGIGVRSAPSKAARFFAILGRR